MLVSAVQQSGSVVQCWILWKLDFEFFEETPYSFLQRGDTSLHSHQLSRRVPLSISSWGFVMCVFFNDGHSDQSKEVPYCSFDLRFSNNCDFEHFFMCLWTICMSWIDVFYILKICSAFKVELNFCLLCSICEHPSQE